MQKSTIETLDLEKLSISARDFIASLSYDPVRYLDGMAVAYANTVINAASEAAEEHCKEMSGVDIPAPVRVDTVCKAIIDMFKDPDCPVNKDKFLRGVVAFMLANPFAEAATDFYKSNKKEESNG